MVTESESIIEITSFDLFLSCSLSPLMEDNAVIKKRENRRTRSHVDTERFNCPEDSRRTEDGETFPRYYTLFHVRCVA